jgi:hypothetical protein
MRRRAEAEPFDMLRTILHKVSGFKLRRHRRRNRVEPEWVNLFG